MKTLNLNWRKCKRDTWCSFDRLDLESVGDVSGVYVIWFEDFDEELDEVFNEVFNEEFDEVFVVYVGQGKIVDRISDHRENVEIQEYSDDYKLYVTWAEVQKSNRGGVEKYLDSKLAPLVGKRHPTAPPPIEVNLPW